MNRAFAVSLSVAAGTALLLHVILTRELLLSFSGGELTIGVVLAGWLLYVAAGADIFGRLPPRLRHSVSTYVLLQLVVAALCPLAMCLARVVGARELFPAGHADPGHVLLYSALVLSPGGLILGGLASVALGIAASAERPHKAQAGLFLMVIAGTAAGSLGHRYLVGSTATAAAVVLALSAANLGVATWLVFATGRHTGPLIKLTVGLFLGGFVALGSVWPHPAAQLELMSQAKRWHGSDATHIGTWNTRQAAWTLLDTGHGQQVHYDGLPAFETSDHAAEEQTVLLALLQHHDPRDVLLVGGGPRAIRAALSSGVERLQYWPIDPEALGILHDQLTPKWSAWLDDPRVTTGRGDLVESLATTPQSLDAVIVCLPGPATLPLSRLYTQQFTRLCLGALKPGGILATSVSTTDGGADSVVGRSIERAFALAAPAAVEVPGDPTCLLATRGSAPSVDLEAAVHRLSERQVGQGIWTPEALRKALAASRILGHDGLAATDPVPANSEVRPAGFLQSVGELLDSAMPPWATLLSPAFAPLAVMTVILVSLLVVMLMWRAGPRWVHSGWVAYCAGFTGAAILLWTTLFYQVVTQTAYSQLGALFAAGAGGVGIGALWGGSAAPGLPAYRDLRRVQGSLLVLCIGAFLLPIPLVELPAYAGWLCGLVLFATGFLCGATVSLVANLYGNAATAMTGLITTACLGGAVSSALLSLLLIPTQGVHVALQVAAVIAAIGLAAPRIVTSLMR